MNLKRKNILLFMVALLTAAVLAACGGNNDSGDSSKDDEGSDSAASNEPVIEMDVNNWAPSTHPFAYNVLEPWSEIVEEKTEGRMKINLHHGGSLGAVTDVLQDLSGGLYDLSLISVNYHFDTKMFPYSIGNLPFAFPDAASASKVMTEFGEKFAMDIYDDVHYLGGVTSTDPYDLYSSKPIKSVEDVKGLKMRVSGKNETPLVEDWDAVPVSIPNADMYEGLQRGTIDTTFYPTSGAISYKLYEVAPYISEMGVILNPMVPAMSKTFYDQLPEDLQQLFDDELGPELVNLYTESYMKEVENAQNTLKEEVEGKGEFVTLPEDVLSEFKLSAEIVWDEWVSTANERGYPGEEMMEEFRKMIEAEGLELPY